jgi:Ca-activated chloride channel homolog
MSSRLRAIAVLLAAAAAGAPGRSAVGAQTFRAGTDAVQVDVLVTRGGRPLAGLTADDFELRDNGVVQDIDAIVLQDVPVTLALVLDVSESVDGPPLEHLRTAVGAAAAALSSDDRVALFTFSHQVALAASATKNRDDVRAAAGAVSAIGATALYDATLAALIMRERVQGRAVMLVFSDGDDTASWIDPRAVLTAAQRSDVVTYAVTLERRLARADLQAVLRDRRERQWFLEAPSLYGRQFLSLLAAETGGSVLVAERSDDLRERFVRVVKEFKSRYILTYTPRNVASGGWHSLEVGLKRQRADVQARRGYLRGPLDSARDKPLDSARDKPLDSARDNPSEP